MIKNFEKLKNSDEGSVFPWDFCTGGYPASVTKICSISNCYIISNNVT